MVNIKISINKFYKSNKMLVCGFIISLVVYISYYITINLPEIIPYGDFLYNLLSQLALAYMGGFIFYIMQVYIPEENKKKKIKESISYSVQGLVNALEELDNVNRDTKMFSESTLRILSNGQITYLDYFEYVMDCMNKINRKCDVVYKNIIYLDDELVRIINKLYDSKEVDTFKLMYSLKSSIDKNIQLHSVINLDEYCSDLEKLKSYLEN